MIYLDNAATTPLTPVVQQAMQVAEQQYYFNANTTYAGGMLAHQHIEQARRTLLRKLHGESGQLIFTAGATQANHLIMAHKIKRPEHQLVITAGDHNSIDLYAKDLAHQGFTVATAPLHRDGTIDLPGTVALINEHTTLLTFSLVNSDIGTYQDAAQLVTAVRAKYPRVHIHADAAQAFAKFDFNVTQLGLDSVTICAHKIHGPKGIGALWMRSGITLPPVHGTLNNAGIIGFATAAETFTGTHVPALHNYLVTNLPAGCQVNGINNNPYITNIALPNVYGETVLNALSSQGIYVGLGSACAAHSANNRTLAAMKQNHQQQKQVLRISFGTQNTLADVQALLAALVTVLQTIGRHKITQ